MLKISIKLSYLLLEDVGEKYTEMTSRDQRNGKNRTERAIDKIMRCRNGIDNDAQRNVERRERRDNNVRERWNASEWQRWDEGQTGQHKTKLDRSTEEPTTTEMYIMNPSANINFVFPSLKRYFIYSLRRVISSYRFRHKNNIILCWMLMYTIYIVAELHSLHSQPPSQEKWNVYRVRPPLCGAVILRATRWRRRSKYG